MTRLRLGGGECVVNGNHFLGDYYRDRGILIDGGTLGVAIAGNAFDSLATCIITTAAPGVTTAVGNWGRGCTTMIAGSAAVDIGNVLY